MTIKKEDLVLWDVLEEDIPELLPKLEELVEKANSGNLDDKLNLAGSLFSLLADPLIRLPHLTKKNSYRAGEQMVEILQEGIAQNHAMSIFLAANIEALNAKDMNGINKAIAFADKLKNNAEIPEDGKAQLKQLIEDCQNDLARKNPPPPAPRP